MRRNYEEQEPLWDARDGLIRFGEVPLFEMADRLYRAVPTSFHARGLIDAMLAQLGDDGRLDPYSDGSRLVVHRCDPTGWWMRRPCAVFAEGAEYTEHGIHQESPARPRPADTPTDWNGRAFRSPPPRPDLYPDCGRATLTLYSGRAALELRYDDQGLLRDDTMFRFGDRWATRRWGALWPPSLDPRARPPQPRPPPWLLELPEEPLSVPALAERILACDPALDPVRIRMNVDAPGGFAGCWVTARRALSKLAMTEALPGTGGVFIIDAFQHEPEESCFASGPDLESALAAWIHAHDQHTPKPTPPPAAPSPTRPDAPASDTEHVDDSGEITRVISSGTIRMSCEPLRQIPWPIPGPHTTPAVAVRYPPLPQRIPEAWRAEGFSRWRYAIGDSGEVGFVLVRDEPDGFTIVGDGLVDVLDPQHLEERITRALEGQMPALWDEPPHIAYPFEHQHFIAWSNLTRATTPLTPSSANWNLEWNWRDFDGDAHRWRVTRLRRH